MAENKISEIQKQSFKDLYLTHINISHNLVEKFEPLSFENCVNMTTLDLSYNLINSFPRKTFDELSYATEFLLSFNQLSNFSAVNKYFQIPRNKSLKKSFCEERKISLAMSQATSQDLLFQYFFLDGLYIYNAILTL